MPALKVYELIAEANNRDREVLNGLLNIADRFDDPDKEVQHAARQTWEKVAAANPGNRTVQTIRKAYKKIGMRI